LILEVRVILEHFLFSITYHVLVILPLQRCTCEFKDNEETKNDPKYVMMWIDYVSVLSCCSSSRHTESTLSTHFTTLFWPFFTTHRLTWCVLLAMCLVSCKRTRLERKWRCSGWHGPMSLRRPSTTS